MADTSKLTAAVTKLGADVSALLQSSANDQPAIDAATAAVTALDQQVVTATPTTPTTPTT